MCGISSQNIDGVFRPPPQICSAPHIWGGGKTIPHSSSAVTAWTCSSGWVQQSLKGSPGQRSRNGQFYNAEKGEIDCGDGPLQPARCAPDTLSIPGVGTAYLRFTCKDTAKSLRYSRHRQDACTVALIPHTSARAPVPFLRRRCDVGAREAPPAYHDAGA